jgi:hypothetical protein
MNYVRTSIPASEYQAVKPSKQRSGKQFYYVRFNAQEKDGIVSAVEVEIDHEPTAAEIEAMPAQYLAHTKHLVAVAIEGHAKSEAVKVFEINSVRGWLDSEERGSIRRAAADKASEGRDVFTLYLSGTCIQMPPAKVEEILKAVEVYASDCHDKTEEHKAAVEALADPDEVQAYDYTAGYPETLSFKV